MVEHFGVFPKENHADPPPSPSPTLLSKNYQIQFLVPKDAQCSENNACNFFFLLFRSTKFT